MKNIRSLSENFHFLVVKFSIYLNRRVFVMVYSIYNDDSVEEHPGQTVRMSSLI